MTSLFGQSSGPLMKEKLQAAKELIDTQLGLKHIEESCSPWNSPIFVIKKKSNKWRLLTDLRKVNASMKPMGALQPGIPSPTIIPQNWHIIIIIDLQDCFFNILLHPLDWERFAFSLPYPSYIGPHKWYQWTVLPQGMMNSPTIAQLCLKNSGLIIAPEKIQTSTPYHYLGFVVSRQHITPQLTHPYW